jgi:hypothetical protein
LGTLKTVLASLRYIMNILCTGAFLSVRYSFLLISNKFYDLSLLHCNIIVIYLKREVSKDLLATLLSVVKNFIRFLSQKVYSEVWTYQESCVLDCSIEGEMRKIGSILAYVLIRISQMSDAMYTKRTNSK